MSKHKLNDLILVSRSEIEKFIKDSEVGMETNQNDEEEYQSYQSINYLAKRMLLRSTPAEDVLLDAYKNGWNDLGDLNESVKNCLNYLDNLEINIGE